MNPIGPWGSDLSFRKLFFAKIDVSGTTASQRGLKTCVFMALSTKKYGEYYMDAQSDSCACIHSVIPLHCTMAASDHR